VSWSGSDHAITGGNFHAEIFIVRSVPPERLTVTEGALRRFTLAELGRIRQSLAPLAQFAIDVFLSGARPINVSVQDSHPH
jgi:hypothetical protein